MHEIHHKFILNVEVFVCLTAPVVSGECLKKYVFHKICCELPDGPFCIVYMHSTVQKEYIIPLAYLF